MAVASELGLGAGAGTCSSLFVARGAKCLRGRGKGWFEWKSPALYEAR